MCNCEEDCNCNEQPVRDTSPWMICPECEGHGKHSKGMGDFTMSEFYECFDDDDSRDDYFAGRYDKSCSTCAGSGKIQESQLNRYEAFCERDLIIRTGRNSAGEPC